MAPVYSVPELVEDPQLLSRGAFVDARHERHGDFRQVGPVLAGADRTQSAYSVRDGSATDTDELLRGVGMTEREIEKMRGEGIVA